MGQFFWGQHKIHQTSITKNVQAMFSHAIYECACNSQILIYLRVFRVDTFFFFGLILIFDNRRTEALWLTRNEQLCLYRAKNKVLKHKSQTNGSRLCDSSKCELCYRFISKAAHQSIFVPFMFLAQRNHIISALLN